MTKRVEAYVHLDAAPDDVAAADPRPGRYYVSVIDGARHGLLYGPFGRHADALAAVEAARRVAVRVDPRAHFYRFGTARLSGDGDAPAGVLNSLLPPIEADTTTEDSDATVD